MADRGEEAVLGEYVLLKTLGEGGMGRVYRARHRLMNRIVALKVIRSDRVAQPEAERRFLREIETLAGLSHPNIVAAFDAQRIDDTLFLVMEYCEGESLGALVRERGPLPIGFCCRCIAQAAEGLQYAADRGLIHRDIKPDNLLLTEDVVKILDFGLARLQRTSNDATLLETGDAITQQHVIVGTSDFIAPEQAQGQPTVDIRADIYSLGCTFYYLLSGEVPFPGGTLIEKIVRHQTEQPALLGALRSGVPEEVLAIQQRMTEKDPNRRFQTPAEVAAALAPFVELGEAATTEWRLPPSQATADPRIDDGGRVDTDVPLDTQPMPATPTPTPQGRSILLLFGAAAAAIFLLLSIVGGLLKLREFTTAPGSTGNAGWAVAAELKPHPSRINAIALSQNARWLAAACGPLPSDPKQTGGVIIWDLQSNTRHGVLGADRTPGYLSVAFAPRRSILVVSSGHWDLPTASAVEVWDVERLKLLATLRGHESGVSTVCFSTDGKQIATVGRFDDTTLRFWDTATILAGNEGQTWQRDSSAMRASLSLQEDEGMLTGGAFSPLGDRFAVVTNAHRVLLCHRVENEWRLEREFRTPDCPVLYTAAFSPDGSRLAVGAGKHDVAGDWRPQVAIWDLDSEREEPRVLPHDTDVWSLAFAADGRTIFTGDEAGDWSQWDVETGTRLHRAAAHPQWTYVARSPNERLLATAGERERIVRLWRGQ